MRVRANEAGARERGGAPIWAAQLALIYHRTHLPPTTRFNMFYECITVSIEIFPRIARTDSLRATGYKYARVLRPPALGFRLLRSHDVANEPPTSASVFVRPPCHHWHEAESRPNRDRIETESRQNRVALKRDFVHRIRERSFRSEPFEKQRTQLANRCIEVYL